MNDDDNYEVIDGKRTKIVRDGGRVVTKMLTMDEQTVTPRRPMRDAALHRPGYRTGQMLQQHTADAATDATLVAARDAKEAAYMDYQRDLILAHKPAAERNAILSQLADARSRSAMESFAAGDPDQEEEEEEEEGEEDEDDDKKERGRNRRQDARSKRREPDQEEREKDDPDGDCSKDARSVASPMSGLECPTCGGNGISSGGKCATCNGNGILNFQSSLVPGDDKALRHFQTNEAVRATQTHTESTVRRDIPDEQTLKQMLDQKQKTLDAYHATEGEQFRKILRGET